MPAEESFLKDHLDYQYNGERNVLWYICRRERDFKEKNPAEMKPKKRTKSPIQSEMFKVSLQDIVFEGHPLVKLSDAIEWKVFEEKLGETFNEESGRPGLPVRLMVGLHYLKHTYSLSDEAAVAGWVENPYWQYFCGGTFFEHKPPIDPSSMSRFRGRLKKAGLWEFLEEMIRTGLR